jgi:hypothetical protein
MPCDKNEAPALGKSLIYKMLALNFHMILQKLANLTEVVICDKEFFIVVGIYPSEKSVSDQIHGFGAVKAW